ncbi:MAG: YeeE/YedE family protein [SAR324 cluster bacterium]|nr:YeeE/YedE family protein [SAR324 cluster bacterium]
MIEQHWEFWVGGLGIASVAFLITILTGKFLAITKGFVSLCGLISKKPVFHQKDLDGVFGFRTFFIFGIVIGGFLAAITSDGWNPSFDYGMFDQIYGNSLLIKAVVLIIGGAFWGYGARLADGCTSGNSIAGISKGAFASVIVSIAFMASGIPATFLINYLAGAL